MDRVGKYYSDMLKIKKIGIHSCAWHGLKVNNSVPRRSVMVKYEAVNKV